MEGSWRQRHPLGRALVPLVAGIGVTDALLWRLPDAERLAEAVRWLPLSGVLSGLGLAIAVVAYRRKGSLAAYILFACSLFVALAFFGARRTLSAWQQAAAPWSADTLYYQGVVLGPPQSGPRSVRLDIRLSACMRADSLYPLQRRVQLTVPATSDAELPAAGDGVAFLACVEPLRRTGNPDGFDATAYLLHKGVYGTAYAPAGCWQSFPLPASEWQALSWGLRLRLKTLRLRERWLDIYRARGWDDDTYAVLAALTVGEKSRLSAGLKALYAEVGAGHLLALSGLHLGLLLVLFEVVMRRVRFSPWRWPAGGALLLLLWGYVLLAGLPVSLVRATLMASLLLGADLLMRRRYTLNTLMLAALLMLAVEPFYLFDVGFRLSFLSLYFILTLAPWMAAWLPLPGHRVRNLLAVSLAAWVGTAPYVAYVFHGLALYAVPLSLVLIPWTALLVYGALLMPLSALFGQVVLSAWGNALDLCVTGQLRLLTWATALPGAYCTELYPSALRVVLLYGLLFLLSRRPPHTRLQTLWATVAGVAGALLFFGLRTSAFPPEPEIVFYHRPSCPTVRLTYTPTSSYVLYASVLRPDTAGARAPVPVYPVGAELPPRVLPPAYADSLLFCCDGLLCAPGVTLLQVSDARWLHRQADAPLPVDYLHVCRGFPGPLRRLVPVVRPALVVLDASLGRRRAERLRRESEALGWAVYEMHERGALKKTLK